MTRKQAQTIEEITYNVMISENYRPFISMKSIEPSWIKIKLLKFLDELLALRYYSGERGFKAAVGYKLKQWNTTCRSLNKEFKRFF